MKDRRIMMISTHGYVSASPEFGKPDTGGQVVYVLELAKCLARLGFQVDIYTRRFEGQSEREIVNDDVQVLRIPCGGDEFVPKETLCDHIPEWVENATAYIAEHHLNYTFINSHYWDAGLAGQLLADRMGIPHLHTPHSIGAWKRENMDGDPADLERKYNFQQRVEEENKLYKACDLLIATTPQQQEMLKTDHYQVPDEKICVIPPGYDDSRFYPVSTATRDALKQDLDAQGPVVLALGRMAHNKGYDLLIRAMKFVVDRVPTASLILAVGSTEPSQRELEQIEELRQVARELGIQESVQFRDYIPDELLPDYYRVADVFALSSRYEPFGMTAVEAMACGTPAVITTEGGLWEQITWGADGIYANPFDPDAYGAALANLLQYPQVADQISTAASELARARFTWTGIAQQLLGVLESTEPAKAGETASAPPAKAHEGNGVAPTEEELCKTAIS